MNKFSKYIVLIIFIFSSYNLVGSDKEVNVYGSVLSTPGVFELNLEYNFLSFDLLGIQSITGIRAGSSMFGIQGLSVRFSTPIIGIVQYFGKDSGLDLGFSYLKHYNFGTDRNKDKPVLYKDDDEKMIRFDSGYRTYLDNNIIFRFSFVSFADFEKLKASGDWDLQFLISASVGYSF